MDTGFCDGVEVINLHIIDKNKNLNIMTQQATISTTPPTTETSIVNDNKISSKQIDLGVDDDSGTYRHKSSHSVESEGNAKEGPTHLDNKIIR